MSRDIKLKIKKLVDDINKWNIEYFDQEKPSVSDRVYDSALKELVDLEKKYPHFILENSPTKKIGSSTRNKFKKIKHKQKMLSLDKAYSIEEINKFINNIKKEIQNENINFYLEPKIDGLSISLSYNEGVLKQAITRGDGIEGEDVTNNVLGIITDIPIKINYLKPLEVRGEVFISKTNFEKINNEEENKYANPRNLASGTLRQLDNTIVKKRNLSSFIYDVVDYDKHNLKTQEEVINFLIKNNFSLFKDKTIANNINQIKYFIDSFNKIKDKLDYEIDGIVIKLNQTKYYEEIGYTSKFPKYSIAYKFDDEIVKTTLEDIFISIGRTGVVTYNARFKKILLKGTMVSAATLHNYNYIEELNINIGDEIQIKKAGEIIPKVVSLSKKHSKGVFKKILICPFCKNKLFDTKTSNNQICKNDFCPEINIRKIIHFASREGMNIEGLGEGIVRKFFSQNFINKIEDIFVLDKYKEDIINFKGFGNKFWLNLWNGINESKNISLDKLIFSLGIPQLGSKNAKQIAYHIKKFSNILDIDINSLTEINDIGPITIDEIDKFIKKESNIKLIKFLIEIGINPSFEQKSFNENNFFFDKTFVITGTFKKTRNELIKLIENKGGKISNSISKNTFALLKGENSGSKEEKAKKLSIRIIEEIELNNLLND